MLYICVLHLDRITQFDFLLAKHETAKQGGMNKDKASSQRDNNQTTRKGNKQTARKSTGKSESGWKY